MLQDLHIFWILALTIFVYNLYIFDYAKLNIIIICLPQIDYMYLWFAKA